MTWLEDFYLSENITDDRKSIKRRISRHKDVLEYYLLTMSDSKEKIDIIPALELLSCPQRKKDSMVIVGVSSGYHNAMQLVKEMELKSNLESNMQGA